MTDHTAHMNAPAVVAAQQAYDEHVAGCVPCRAATRQRGLCEQGAKLHEAVVIAAQDAYRAAKGSS